MEKVVEKMKMTNPNERMNVEDAIHIIEEYLFSKYLTLNDNELLLKLRDMIINTKVQDFDFCQILKMIYLVTKYSSIIK